MSKSSKEKQPSILLDAGLALKLNLVKLACPTCWQALMQTYESEDQYWSCSNVECDYTVFLSGGLEDLWVEI